ncbi:MAG: D-glycerate 2-kinase (EC [uncultured Thiotrichaceae bacterium]|uniref:D-glycerate 2-kinase (EC) n=1 Tax=uncultured Thiotrichaceae bacterium TaxID=298394 RepID=A0A6S6T006_9GAMM|nr:MAG: D-glycerate 2-kinase (EC [uncultured Thiotrichaceae bacterium]
MKNTLLTIFDDALHSVIGKQAVQNALSESNSKLLATGSINIVAIGKAAESMLEGAFTAIPNANIGKALLITKWGHADTCHWDEKKVTIIEASHPIPDQSSLDAGKALIDFVAEGTTPLLFLISGGASSLVEQLQATWDFDTFQEMTRWMLSNSYSIDEINAVRQSASTIKAGGLWRYIKATQVHCLLISDVPLDDVCIIGSGLLFPPASALQIPESLPERWRSRLTGFNPATPSPDFSYKVIASNLIARNTAGDSAKKAGFNVVIHNAIVENDALETAEACVKKIIDTPNTLFIWGAETTVNLPENPGRGGRNQHLALAAAKHMQNTSGCYLLAAGTDGTDGMTEDTGALVDSETITRGEAENVDATTSLAKADAGTFLDASGDLISTGVTGTNVMDLIFAIRIEN